MKTLRRLLLVVALLFVAGRVPAPSTDSFVIYAPNPVNPFGRLIHAIGMVETKHDTLAFNPVEEAVGYFQIRPVRLEDYNRRTGSNIKMDDLYNYEISERIFLYYASRIGHNNFEKIARNWNGSGPMTFAYWNRVKKHL
jgi:hypothetical protein